MFKIKLQPIYLANIALYIPSISTLKRFEQVSKHCQEALHIVKYFSPKYESETKYLNISKELHKRKVYFEGMPHCELFNNDGKIIPNNFKLLLPNIQTLSCSDFKLNSNEKEIQSVENINITVHSLNNNQLPIPDDLKPKIRRLEIKCDLRKTSISLKQIMDEFQFVREIIIHGMFGNDNKQIKLKQYHRLSKLIIYLENDLTGKQVYNQLQEINSFDWIENKTIVYQNKPIQWKSLNGWNEFDENDILSVDCSEYFPNETEIDLKSIILHIKFHKSFFDKMNQIKLFNLNTIQSLQHLTCISGIPCSLPFIHPITSSIPIQIKQCTQLKQLTNAYQIDSLPQSVTKIVYDEYYDSGFNTNIAYQKYDWIKEFDINWTMNSNDNDIRYLLGEKKVKAERLNITLNDYDKGMFKLNHFDKKLKLLKQIKQYKEIKEKNITINIIFHETIKDKILNELKSIANVTINQCILINMDIYPIKQIPSTLTHLEITKMNYHLIFENNYFHSQIKNLSIKDWSDKMMTNNYDLNLSSFTNCTSIELKNTVSIFKSIQFPTSLQSLSLENYNPSIQLPSSITSLSIQCSINNIQEWNIESLTTLKSLFLRGNLNVQLPTSIQHLDFVQNVSLDKYQQKQLSNSLIDLSSFTQLTSLTYSGNNQIIYPSSLQNVSMISNIDIFLSLMSPLRLGRTATQYSEQNFSQIPSLKSLKLSNFMKVYLPSHLEYLEMDESSVICNPTQCQIDTLFVHLKKSIDLTQFIISNKLRISSPSNDNLICKIYLPQYIPIVELPSNVKIENKNEITIHQLLDFNIPF